MPDFDENSPEFRIVKLALSVGASVTYIDAIKKFYFHGHELSLKTVIVGMLEQQRAMVVLLWHVMLYKVTCK